MNKDFGWFLEQTAPYSIPNVGFTTNGVLLTESMAQRCIRTPVHEVSVSLDGSRAETYERIRPEAKWDQVLANIRQLVQLRDAARSPYPRLRLNYVLMRCNIEEVVEFVDLARDLGASIVDFRHVVVFDIAREMRNESLFRERDLANVWLERAKVRADQLGVQVAYLPMFPRRPGLERVRRWWRKLRKTRGNGPRCGAPWETVVITHLGFVGPCVGWLRDPPLGNLTRQMFDDILNGPEMTRLRDGLLGRGPLPDSCAACPTISSRSTEQSAFTEVELDLQDRIWLETYAQEFGWDAGASIVEP
jgi:MoaA/NifB/PqqE/SkfB family radical SAM enzyme